jgi:hypothetical protein
LPGFQAAILNRLGRDNLNFFNELLTEGKRKKYENDETDLPAGIRAGRHTG